MEGGGFQDPFSAFSEFWSRAQGSRTQQQDFEENIFEDFASFFDMGQSDRRGGKGSDLFLSVELDFMESIQGVKKELQFERKGTCSMCNGNRCKPGTAPGKCVACGGKGFSNFRQGPMTI